MLEMVALMKILVLSDSHSIRNFMHRCVERFAPDAIIHLGDYVKDGAELKAAYPNIPFYQVQGNCDRYRCPPSIPEVLVERICGVELYLTHGHLQGVKSGLAVLKQEARNCRVAGVLFGHTHEAYCVKEPDGLWVLNPGTSGFIGSSVGIVETDGRNICSCRIVKATELD